MSSHAIDSGTSPSARCARFIAAVFTTLAIGCSQAAGPPPAPLLNPNGLVYVPAAAPGALYVKPDNHIATYDGYWIEPPQIEYRLGRSRLSKQRTAELASGLKRQLETAVKLSGVDLMTGPHDCALAVRIRIIDLELLDLDRAASTSTSFLTSAGNAVFLFEYRDSRSGELLLQYGQKRAFPGGKVFQAGALSSEGLTERFADTITGMGAALRGSIPRSETGREGVACQGKVGIAEEAGGDPRVN